MKFRQLLALICYHYLVSDQDFKKCCDEVSIFKVEYICLHKMVVLEIFTPNVMNATVLPIVYITQPSRLKMFFFSLK